MGTCGDCMESGFVNSKMDLQENSNGLSRFRQAPVNNW